AEDACSYRNGDCLACIVRNHSTGQTIGGAHRNDFDSVVSQHLLDFTDYTSLIACRIGAFDLQRVVNLGKVSAGELDVDNGADNLHDATLRSGGGIKNCAHRFSRKSMYRYGNPNLISIG